MRSVGTKGKKDQPRMIQKANGFVKRCSQTFILSGCFSIKYFLNPKFSANEYNKKEVNMIPNIEIVMTNKGWSGKSITPDSTKGVLGSRKIPRVHDRMM